MGIRIGVDVGGTFTKAVAWDMGLGRITAQAVLPTTHDDPEGVAAGVVAAVQEVTDSIGADQVELVVHSTTQAVNALLEGDVGRVGVIGLGRRPEISKVRRRTELSSIQLAPGKRLRTVPAFFDVTDGLPVDAIRRTLEGWHRDGISSVSVAEAFAPDDSTNEETVARLATELGLPACASTELTGLYGLELRAVTAAINASIVPIALRTAGFVERGVAAAGISGPLLVMRGDGGATDLDGFRAAPARTLYSGPAASVAGALRHADIGDGVVVEIGGTSTNVAAISKGEPSLSYVRVASHATALRSVDVRVIGVAGGSMLRVRRSRAPLARGRLRVYGVGPRSAHIAGLAYACYEPAAEIAGARPVEFSPLPEDPPDYLALKTPAGRCLALTNTCAANALGITRPGDYAHAPPAAALAAFEIAGEALRLDGREVARRMLEASGSAVCALVAAAARDSGLERPPVIAVGGGAGGLGRLVASMLRLECRVPEGAEVISSVGDALSLVRAERERTVDASDAALVTDLMDEVEAEVLAAGASSASIEVRVEERPEKGTVRAVATGAVGLTAGARPGRPAIDSHQARALAAERGGSVVEAVGAFWVATAAPSGTGAPDGPVLVLDRYGDRVVETSGVVLGPGDLDAVGPALARLTRHRGPVLVSPSMWVIRRSRCVELASGDRASSAAALVGDGQSGAIVVGAGPR